MFWSKIWFFLVAIAAATAMALALSMPRPAERASIASETVRLKRACGVATILLTQNARDRVDLAANFARADAPAGSPRLKLDDILFNASKGEIVSDDAHATAKAALAYLLDSVKGKKPDFVIAVNRQGLAVARAGVDEAEYGDSLAGYYAVDDALDGFLRDDIWIVNGKLYRVAVSPVVERRENAYAGALILGHEFDKELTERLAENIGAQVSFYANGDAAAASTAAQIHKDVVAKFRTLRAEGVLADAEADAAADCSANDPFTVTAGNTQYDVVLARLPGEAQRADAFYAVFSEKPPGLGFSGTYDQLTSTDMSFGTFPWIRVGVVFLIIVGGGLGLMYMEADRPIRGLMEDATGLAQGDKARLHELAHKGKTGSIARSVNIALDKLERDAKSAKRDLDSLLGPAPDQPSRSSATIPPAPPSGPSAQPFRPPPPSEFKFNDGGAGTASGGNARPPMRPGAPPPFELDLPPPPPGMNGDDPPFEAPVDTRVPPPPVSLPMDAIEPPEFASSTPGGPPVAIDDDILASARQPAARSRPTSGSGGFAGSPSTAGAPRGRASAAPSPTIPPPAATPPPAARPPARASMSRPASDFDAPTRVADPSMGLLQQSADDDDLSAPDTSVEDREFRKVFDEFTALKQQCGESVESLTYDKFAGKLRRNREALMAKHGCKSVKFQVYIKDGKAALKATPVKS